MTIIKLANLTGMLDGGGPAPSTDLPLKQQQGAGP